MTVTIQTPNKGMITALEEYFSEEIVVLKSLQLKVVGAPMQMPKKEIGQLFVRGGGRRPSIIENLKQVKRAKVWRKLITDEAQRLFTHKDRIMKPSGIFVIATVYIERPKSNKSPYPVTRPDNDNYHYLHHNILEGILYEDDSQIIDNCERKRWALGNREPGVDINLFEIRNKKV